MVPAPDCAPHQTLSLQPGPNFIKAAWRETLSPNYGMPHQQGVANASGHIANRYASNRLKQARWLRLEWLCIMGPGLSRTSGTSLQRGPSIAPGRRSSAKCGCSLSCLCTYRGDKGMCKVETLGQVHRRPVDSKEEKILVNIICVRTRYAHRLVRWSSKPKRGWYLFQGST